MAVVINDATAVAAALMVAIGFSETMEGDKAISARSRSKNRSLLVVGHASANQAPFHETCHQMPLFLGRMLHDGDCGILRDFSICTSCRVPGCLGNLLLL